MINLHAKIFIGFWLSMLAIIGSWLLAGQYFGSFERQFEANNDGRPPALSGAPERPLPELR